MCGLRRLFVRGLPAPFVPNFSFETLARGRQDCSPATAVRMLPRFIALPRLLRNPVWALSLLATTTACGRIGFEVLADEDASVATGADDTMSSSPADAAADVQATDESQPGATSSDATSADGTDVPSPPEPSSPDAASPNDAASEGGVNTSPEATNTSDSEPMDVDASSMTPPNDDTAPSANTDAGPAATEPSPTSFDASTPTNASDADVEPADAGSSIPTDPTEPTQDPGVIPGDAGESDASADASVEGGVQLADAGVSDGAPPIAIDAGGCTPSNTGFESCDGIDNDCDTLIDEDGCPTTCHGAATADNGYMVCDELVGYDVAAAACESQGLLLVTIDSAELNQALSELMYPADGSMDQLYFWIGASRVDSSSAWTWADGATWGTYANWKNGVPGNAGNANCIQVDDLARWLAGQCTQTKRYACELNPP